MAAAGTAFAAGTRPAEPVLAEMTAAVANMLEAVLAAGPVPAPGQRGAGLNTPTGAHSRC